MRYLAELPWVPPYAIFGNRNLEWREIDGDSVEVAIQVGATRVAVHLRFDAAGDIVGSSADALWGCVNSDSAPKIIDLQAEPNLRTPQAAEAAPTEEPAAEGPPAEEPPPGEPPAEGRTTA